MRTWVKREIDLPRPVQRGEKGQKAKAVQEWLSHAGHHVNVDGDFGPATQKAVANFRAAVGIPGPDNTVDLPLFTKLVEPAVTAVTVPALAGIPLWNAVVAIANQHLGQRPHEIGGQNRGPWVRIYMEGNEGEQWPWCAGFACFVLQQACEATGQRMPFARSFSCDVLATQAKNASKLVTAKDIRKGRVTKTDLKPGSLFLNCRTDNDWVHTGIVTAFYDDHFETIEGNTNDAGDREGYEVCKRIRGYDAKDFLVY